MTDDEYGIAGPPDPEDICTCGHERSAHTDDGVCIHGDGDDGCIQFEPGHVSPNRSKEP